jgi:hypothetical protein
LIKIESELRAVHAAVMIIKEVMSHILGQTMGTVITAVQAVLTIIMGHLLTIKKLDILHHPKQIIYLNMQLKNHLLIMKILIL